MESIFSDIKLVLSPSYFNYTYCSCSYGYFGQPPECTECQTTIPEGICYGGNVLTYAQNYWPVFQKAPPGEGQLLGFLPCLKDDVCNPEGLCEIAFRDPRYAFSFFLHHHK